MKTIRMLVELTYDDDIMYSNDPESKRWFESEVLFEPEEPLILHSNVIGDEVGTVEVLWLEGAA